MSWYNDLIAIRDAIKNTLITVTEIKSIVFGKREHIGQLSFPCLFIIFNTDDILTAEATQGGRQHNYNWELVLISRNPDVEQGEEEILQVAGNCYDKLILDNTLGGVCLWSEVLSVESDSVRVDAGSALQWATINLKTVKFRG